MTKKKFDLEQTAKVGQMKVDEIFNLPQKNLNAGLLNAASLSWNPSSNPNLFNPSGECMSFKS